MASRASKEIIRLALERAKSRLLDLMNIIDANHWISPEKRLSVAEELALIDRAILAAEGL